MRAPVVARRPLPPLAVCLPGRDLKLDNTLLSDDEPPLLKLCDFGFARQWEGQNNAQMFTHIG